MAIKITKTEKKLHALIIKRNEDSWTRAGNKLATFGRGFGKTRSSAQYLSSLFELDLAISRLQFKVAKIQKNREKALQRKEEAKVTRRLNREGQKLAKAIHNWLGA